MTTAVPPTGHVPTLVTINFFVRPGEVLLIKKKRSIGQGLWNGPGGKDDPKDFLQPRRCAVREIWEETRSRVLHRALRLAAKIEFQVEGKKTFDGFIYLIHEWAGRQMESSETGEPTWFSINKLPKDKLMHADVFWLPRILRGERLCGRANYSKGFETLLNLELRPGRFDPCE